MRSTASGDNNSRRRPSRITSFTADRIAVTAGARFDATVTSAWTRRSLSFTAYVFLILHQSLFHLNSLSTALDLAHHTPDHTPGTPHQHTTLHTLRTALLAVRATTHRHTGHQSRPHRPKLRPAPSTTALPQPSMILEVAAAMTFFSFGPTLLGVHFARGLHLGKLKKAAMLASPPSAQDVRDVCVRDVCDAR